jgi:hypothetical protein
MLGNEVCFSCIHACVFPWQYLCVCVLVCVFCFVLFCLFVCLFVMHRVMFVHVYLRMLCVYMLCLYEYVHMNASMCFVPLCFFHVHALQVLFV